MGQICLRQENILSVIKKTTNGKFYFYYVLSLSLSVVRPPALPPIYLSSGVGGGEGILGGWGGGGGGGGKGVT